ncbi:hypothetical protein GW17_00024009 [Ensete ventricosum]|nr:hypothetical protein GW17_00024009 [Ensete ventricosum]
MRGDGASPRAGRKLEATWEHFFPNPSQILEIVQRPRSLAPWWGRGTVAHLPGSFPWTYAVGPGDDGNDPNYHSSYSLSVLRPSACLTNPSTIGPARDAKPTSSTSSASDASTSIFSEYPIPRTAHPRWVPSEWGAVTGPSATA